MSKRAIPATTPAAAKPVEQSAKAPTKLLRRKSTEQNETKALESIVVVPADESTKTSI